MKVKVQWNPAYYLCCCTFSVALQAQMFSMLIVLPHIVQFVNFCCYRNLFSFSALDSHLYSRVYQKVTFKWNTSHSQFSIIKKSKFLYVNKLNYTKDSYILCCTIAFCKYIFVKSSCLWNKCRKNYRYFFSINVKIVDLWPRKHGWQKTTTNKCS